MDIEMFGKISDAFGPSGFEEEVVRTVGEPLAPWPVTAVSTRWKMTP